MPKPLVDPRVSMAGQTALVTGANTGIGKVTALELARTGAHVILACRNETKARAAMAEIEATVPNASLEFLALDLGRLSAVRQATDTLKQGGRSLHVLVNNAGLAGMRGQTEDGFELAFGVNHLGHFAFTTDLLELIADGGRIVNVASRAHYRAKGIDWDAVRRPTVHRTGLAEYSVSKLANVLFTARLAEVVEPRGIDCYSLHPGVVASDVWREVPRGLRQLMKAFMLSNEDGARTTLHCATAESARGQTGLYWDKCQPKPPSGPARDLSLQRTLWDKSAEWVAA